MKVQFAGWRDLARLARWSLAAALLLSTAAHSAATVPLDSNWRRLRSEHFTLTTDHSEGEARQSLRSLEGTRAMLLSGVWGSSTLAGSVRIQVLVLSHDTDFERYFGRTVTGLATELGGVPTILRQGYGWQACRDESRRPAVAKALAGMAVEQVSRGQERRN